MVHDLKWSLGFTLFLVVTLTAMAPQEVNLTHALSISLPKSLKGGVILFVGLRIINLMFFAGKKAAKSAEVLGENVRQAGSKVASTSDDFVRFGKEKIAKVVAGDEGELQSIPDHIFEQISSELEEGKKDVPMWLRAVALGGGDDARAISIYIKMRAKQLNFSKP